MQNDRSELMLHTATGRLVDVMKPDPDTIVIEDIARSLSRIPRWLGHTSHAVAYSVAQHSVRVSLLLNATGYELEGLLHDAHEAFLGDIPRPVAHAIGITRITSLKYGLDLAIARRFHLEWSAAAWDAVHQADDAELQHEFVELVRPATGLVTESRLDQLQPLPPAEAEELFLIRFRELFTERIKTDQPSASEARP